MAIDDALLIARVAFLVALYLFLVLLAVLLRRELRTSSTEERGPADLLMVEPGETGLEAGERIPLLTNSSIGRNEENDVVLEDNFVSAEHARLIWNGKGWTVKDLDSTNGTFVNGKELHKTAPIKPGDVLEFGHIKVKLVSI